MHNILSASKAYAIARRAHDGQTYDGKSFTEGHLAEVARWSQAISALERLSERDSFLLLEGAWLHDILEDTPMPRTELMNEFDRRVADLVFAVTDEPGESRKVRKSLTYPKTKAGGPLAVGVKLADRIANVMASTSPIADPKHNKLYRAEHAEFRRQLETPGEFTRTWNLLETLLT